MTGSRWLRLLGISTVLITGLGLVSPLLADPPGRVARLSLIQGSVSFHPATVDDWAPAQLNYPLTTGDGLWTDANSRAELHAGSTAIQIAPQTDSRILNLDDRTVQMQISQGTTELRIRNIYPDEMYEVDTPNVAISPVRPGWYRIDVDAQGNTIVTSRDGGQAEVTAAGMTFSVNDNQTGRISGTDSPTYDVENAPPLDGFDQWCLSRYEREERVASLRHVSRELIGYEDLDPYGYWQDVPGYGPSWIPSHLVAGWAPYRYGRWCWEEPWGWTWIDDQPWGFATCHYGRWIHTSNWGWGWIPGPLRARPYYAPALVAFVGGNNWGSSFSFGGGGPIGWFPLGPREIYVPPYQATNVYVRNVNYEVRDFRPGRMNGRYINRGFPGAITVIPQRAFVNSDPVHQSLIRVSPRELASARVLGMTAPVVPRRESVLAHAGGFSLSRIPTPPAAVRNRPVVVRQAPPPPRIPFNAQAGLLSQHPGRPPAPATLNNLRSQARLSGPPVRMATVQGPSAGMRAARPGIPPARPVPGAQVRMNSSRGLETPPSVRPQPNAPGVQRAQRGFGPQDNQGGRASRQSAPPGGQMNRPPERMGRTQPLPSAAAPRPQITPPQPRPETPRMQQKGRPNTPPQAQFENRSRPQMQSTPQAPRPQAAPRRMETPRQQNAPQRQMRSNPPPQQRQGPPATRVQPPPQPRPAPQPRVEPRQPQNPPQRQMRSNPPQVRQPENRPRPQIQPQPQRSAPPPQMRPPEGGHPGGGPPSGGGGGKDNQERGRGKH